MDTPATEVEKLLVSSRLLLFDEITAQMKALEVSYGRVCPSWRTEEGPQSPHVRDGADYLHIKWGQSARLEILFPKGAETQDRRLI